MPNFLVNILAQLQRSSHRVVLREIHGEKFVGVTGAELLEQVQRVRSYVRSTGPQPGDRCALLAPNSMLWAAFDLALMAEGLIVVPLYSRQSPAELGAMMSDSEPRMLFVSDRALGVAAMQSWPREKAAPEIVSFDDVVSRELPLSSDPLRPRGDADIVTIIYTSGTSGEAKGVCLTVGNLNHMLRCTTERLDQLMARQNESERVFHYAPFNFAASWILLLSCLSRDSTLTLSTDLTKLPDEIRLAEPHYFLNVPTLLERVRRGVEEAIAKRPAFIRSLYHKARLAWQHQRAGRGAPLDALWLGLGRAVIFNKVRQRFGRNLRALICGSAPLAPETQEFFLMLGIPVVQAYGLT